MALDIPNVRLNGWQRIGVVLSCLWIAPSLFMFDWQSVKRSDELAQPGHEKCLSEANTETIEVRKQDFNICRPNLSGLDAEVAKYLKCDDNGFLDSLDKRARAPSQAAALVAACEANFLEMHGRASAAFRERLLAAVLPVPLAWLFCWLTLLAIRWVRGGFGEAKPSSVRRRG